MQPSHYQKSTFQRRTKSTDESQKSLLKYIILMKVFLRNTLKITERSKTFNKKFFFSEIESHLPRINHFPKDLLIKMYSKIPR